MAGFDVVIGTVVGAFYFRNLWATRERTRRLQRGHHGLGAGIHEANLIKARATRADVLRMQNFLLSGHHEGAAARKLRRGGLNNRLICVSMNQRGNIVCEVDAGDTIDISDAATLAVRHIGWNRRPQYGVAADTAGHHLLGALKELRAAAGCWCGCARGGVGGQWSVLTCERGW